MNNKIIDFGRGEQQTVTADEEACKITVPMPREIDFELMSLTECKSHWDQTSIISIEEQSINSITSSLTLSSYSMLTCNSEDPISHDESGEEQISLLDLNRSKPRILENELQMKDCDTNSCSLEKAEHLELAFDMNRSCVKELDHEQCDEHPKELQRKGAKETQQMENSNSNPLANAIKSIVSDATNDGFKEMAKAINGLRDVMEGGFKQLHDVMEEGFKQQNLAMNTIGIGINGLHDVMEGGFKQQNVAMNTICTGINGLHGVMAEGFKQQNAGLHDLQGIQPPRVPLRTPSIKIADFNAQIPQIKIGDFNAQIPQSVDVGEKLGLPEQNEENTYLEPIQIPDVSAKGALPTANHLDDTSALLIEDKLPINAPVPRLCIVKKSSADDEYGFKLVQKELNKEGIRQYIGNVNDGSLASSAGLRQGDLILAVNGCLVKQLTHQQVVELIKSNPLEFSLSVMAEEDVLWYKDQGIKIFPDLPNIEGVINFPVTGIDSSSNPNINFPVEIQKIGSQGTDMPLMPSLSTLPKKSPQMFASSNLSGALDPSGREASKTMLQRINKSLSGLFGKPETSSTSVQKESEKCDQIQQTASEGNIVTSVRRGLPNESIYYELEDYTEL